MYLEEDEERSQALLSQYQRENGLSLDQEIKHINPQESPVNDSKGHAYGLKFFERWLGCSSDLNAQSTVSPSL